MPHKFLLNEHINKILKQIFNYNKIFPFNKESISPN